MSDLNRDAQELLRAARSFDEPSVADASRVHAAVLAKVGVAVGVGAAGASIAAPSAAAASSLGIFSATVMKVGAAVVLAGGLATAGYVAVREPRAMHVNVAVTPAVEGRAPVASPGADRTMIEPTPMGPLTGDLAAPRAVDVRAPNHSKPHRMRTPPASGGSHGATRAPSDLEAEARLLEQADGELRRGDPNAALARLSEHAAQYPTGALREEREGIRVIALCRAGREEAKPAAERFLAHAPRSALASRIRTACGD